MTGGLGSERQVWMNPAFSSATWKRKNDMLQGRKGHAAAVVKVSGVEVMVLAGGWEEDGQELASVDVYKPSQDQWARLPSMQSPRVDFALQVLIRQYSVRAV